uniref:Ancient ubiquitous protein 1-like n=1 Tax=Hirondellea gigas TaxID=1518452 RepID=A0A2P2HYR6_9CRUS
MNTQIDKLFNKNRLDGSVLQLLLLTCYTPIGLVLMVVRFFISLQLIFAVTVLPRGATITRLVLRCLCGVLGLVVRQENLQNNPLYEDEQLADQQQSSCDRVRESRKRLVVLSNHITPFDHFALSTVMPCIKLSCNGDNIPWPLSYLLGNQIINLHSESLTAPPPPPSNSTTTQPPQPPPRRDETFLNKLRAFVSLGNAAGGRSRSSGGDTTTSNSSVETTTMTTTSGDNSTTDVRKSSNVTNTNCNTITGTTTTNSSTGVSNDSSATENNTSTDNTKSGSGDNNSSSRGSYGTSVDSVKKPAKSSGIDNALPLLIFPEDCTTNGAVALMQYQQWAASVCGERPSVVCVRVARFPALPLAASVLTSPFLQHLLALFFCPFTVYTVRYLGRIARLSSESDAEFGKRLQAVSAKSLGLQTSTYDVLEKVEYVKRCITAQQQQQQQQQQWSGATSATELQRMARQVHEVLPHLPLTAILRDIARTANVDITITNFLEGSASITTAEATSQLLPPSATISSSVNAHPSTSFSFFSGSSSSSNAPMLVSAASAAATSIGAMSANSSPINLCTKAESFPRSANERMLSFHERKALLLENAVRNYVQRFGLHGENDPYMKTS